MSDVIFNPGEPQFSGSAGSSKQSAMVRLAMKVLKTNDEAKANAALLVFAAICFIAAIIVYFIYS